MSDSYYEHKILKYKKKINNILKNHEGHGFNTGQYGGTHNSNIGKNIKKVSIKISGDKCILELDNASQQRLCALLDSVQAMKSSSSALIGKVSVSTKLSTIIQGVDNCNKHRGQNYCVRLVICITPFIENNEWKIKYMLYATEIPNENGKGGYLGPVQLFSESNVTKTFLTELALTTDETKNPEIINKIEEQIGDEVSCVIVPLHGVKLEEHKENVPNGASVATKQVIVAEGANPQEVHAAEKEIKEKTIVKEPLSPLSPPPLPQSPAQSPQSPVQSPVQSPQSKRSFKDMFNKIVSPSSEQPVQKGGRYGNKGWWTSV
jgi:hypothetical protein